MFCGNCRCFVAFPVGHPCFADSILSLTCDVPTVDGKCVADQSLLNHCPRTCVGCGVPSFSSSCSKRCAWAVEGKCPQCGRQKLLDQAFCSVSCASQASQANWCGSCGLRQIQMGFSHCSEFCASAGASNVPVRHRRKVVQQISNLSHQILSQKDRTRLVLTSVIAPLLGETGHTIVNIVKIADHTVRKKAYLNYRTTVEQQLSFAKLPKYSHGGEGNEHKQYIPLVLKCSLGAGANPFALPQTPVDCCTDSTCEVCSVLNNGLSLRLQSKASHYCTANPATAISWCQPQGHSRLMAVALCRVVVGNPRIVASTEQIASPDNFFHSCIVSDGNPCNDGTYVFRDDAIEVQNIVLFV